MLAEQRDDGEDGLVVNPSSSESTIHSVESTEIISEIWICEL